MSRTGMLRTTVAAGVLLLAANGTAHAHWGPRVSIGIGFPLPIPLPLPVIEFYEPAPVYYAPAAPPCPRYYGRPAYPPAYYRPRYYRERGYWDDGRDGWDRRPWRSRY